MQPDSLGSIASPGEDAVVVSPSTLCRDVDYMFRADPQKRSVIVGGGLGADSPVLVNRGTFYQVMTGPRGYGWPLYSGKPISEILGIIPEAIVKPADSAVIETGLWLLNYDGLAANDDILVSWPDGDASPMATSSLLGAVAHSYASKVEEVVAAERRFRALVRGSSDVIGVIDAGGVITYLSDAAERVTGHRAQDRLGESAFTFIHPDDTAPVRSLFARLLEHPRSEAELSFRLLRSDGEWRWMEGTARNLVDDDAVGGVIVNFRDVTERQTLQDQLRHQALHDGLTGLPNRTLIKDRAAQMLARAGRGGHACAILLIDLDGFKDVNDLHGHSSGDNLLSLVAERLRLTLRASDTVGRLGGDEFVALVEGQSLDAGPDVVAQRIIEALRTPFQVDGKSLTITASIGIAAGVRDDVDELLRDADIAMYEAKGSGRNRAATFSSVMKEEAQRRSRLAAELPGALERKEFILHYQPAFSLSDGAITGAEALLRWQHPERGIVGPAEIIPLLEESGLIAPVTRWILEESCGMAAALHAEGYPITISVNISARHLDEEDRLHDDVVHALSVSNLNPRWLVLEITETTLMRDADATARHLHRVKELGVRIAIDDFGTGYSSLSYLAAFPVDSLKVDRSFVANLGRSSEADALLQSVLELGRALSLDTVAEGIEEETQLAVLRRYGCDVGQGFRLAYPGPADQLRDLLHGRHQPDPSHSSRSEVGATGV